MKTAEEIYSSLKEMFEESSGRDISDDCDMAVRLYALAAETESLYIYNDWIKKQCFPQTAEGEFLDNHAAMRGLTRSMASKATGTIRFSIPEAIQTDLDISTGTVCLTASGIYFKTTEDAVIEAGSLYCDVSAEADAAGTEGNVAAGRIVYMSDAPVGVSACENIAEFTGGADAETDESLRARVLSSFRKLPDGANKAYYEKEALEVDGVASAIVMPKARGLGTVDIIITTEAGEPSSELLDTVRNKLDRAREICVDVEVSGPDTQTVNITAKIDVDSEYTFGEVSDRVSEAISSYFNGSLLGRSVTRAELGRIIYGTAGVKNYSIQTPASDVSVNDNELPVLGNVTINTWS